MSNLKIATALAAIIAAGVFIGAPARAESVMKECGAEWKAAKAANTTNGETWTAFLKDCKARHASAAAAPAPAPAPVAAAAPAPAPAAAPAPKPMRTRMAKATPATATGAGEFASEGEARGHCPSDTVVWVNTKSHKYHYAGHRSYGTTKQGAYMCEADAKGAGDVGAKGEKPKT